MMNLCDFFIFPSLYETGPQVVLEAKHVSCLFSFSRRGEGDKKEWGGWNYHR